jgi:hypothetical protein
MAPSAHLPAPASIRVLGTGRMKTQTSLESSHWSTTATIDAVGSLRLPFFSLRGSRNRNAWRPRRVGGALAGPTPGADEP